MIAQGGVGRAFVSSLLATASDYCAFAFLLWCGVPAIFATLSGCVVGGVINFTVNRRWAFGAHGSLARAAWRYFTISGVSAVANSMLVGVVIRLLGAAPHRTWVIVRGAVFLFFTFPMFRHWVFVLRGRTLDPFGLGTGSIQP